MEKRVVYLVLLLLSLTFLITGCNSEVRKKEVGTKSKILSKKYFVCDNTKEAKKVIDSEKEGLLFMTFSDPTDKKSFEMQNKIYLDVEKELQKKGWDATISLVNYAKDEEIEKKFMLRRLPQTVVIRKGIPVSIGFE